jgi:biopolymer transport protein ExbB
MDNAFGGLDSLLSAGGSMLVPILIASVWSVAMLFDGIWQSNRAGSRLSVLPLIDKKGLSVDELKGADPVTALFRWRLENPQAPLTDLREARDRIFAAIERRYSWLNVLAAIAPLFGLLGTVFGMIHIFQIVSVTKPSNPIAALSGGIAEALVATAGGLIVAVIASVGYHFIANRFAGIEANTEAWLSRSGGSREESRLGR